jgi:hypothetical protein
MVVLTMAGAATAEAGILGGGKKLPKPISLTTKRVERSLTYGQQVKHPPKKYSGASWGSRFDQVRDNYPVRPPIHYIMTPER